MTDVRDSIGQVSLLHGRSVKRSILSKVQRIPNGHVRSREVETSTSLQYDISLTLCGFEGLERKAGGEGVCVGIGGAVVAEFKLGGRLGDNLSFLSDYSVTLDIHIHAKM